MCRDGIKKAKAHIELKLARDMKNNKSFYIYTGQKRKAKESVAPLINEKGDLATTDMETTDILNVSSLSVGLLVSLYL